MSDTHTNNDEIANILKELDELLHRQNQAQEKFKSDLIKIRLKFSKVLGYTICINNECTDELLQCDKCNKIYCTACLATEHLACKHT